VISPAGFPGERRGSGGTGQGNRGGFPGGGYWHAHGFYEGKPEINFKRLGEVNAAIDIPLVLHGGTGIPEEDIHQAIRNGINKVNVGTIIHCTYMNALREELVRRGPNPYTLDVIKRSKSRSKRW